MKKIAMVTLLIMIGGAAISQSPIKKDEMINQKKDYPKSLADYNDFKKLVLEVETYREERLIDLDAFLKMSQEDGVIILDTRSTFRYNRKHIKGAVHLSFADFTQQTLGKLIPNPDTKILIYCNNNFDGDQIDFASKFYSVISIFRLVSVEWFEKPW